MEPAVQKRRSSGQVLILPVPHRPPEEESQPPRKRRWLRRAVLFGLLGAVVVGALITTGYVVYQQQQEKRIQKELARARRMARLDTILAYREALRILKRLAEKRPDDPQISVLVAEIQAFLWGRWKGDEKARRQAEHMLRRAQRSGGDGARIAAVKGYLLLYKGRFAEAVEHAETALLTHKRSGRLGYVLGLARYYLGDLNAAEATLQLAVTRDGRFLPARVALARVRRLRGRPVPAAAILQEVLAESPRHLEARIERFLALLKQSKPYDRVVLAKLVKRAAPYRTLHARALRALAIQARRDGESQRVRELLTQSALLAPEDPAIALALTEAQLLPGGDARKAWAIQERIRERSREFRHAASVFARSALAVGRPDLAVRLLRRHRTGKANEKVAGASYRLKIHAAFEQDMPAVADPLCQGSHLALQPARLACFVNAARSHRSDVLGRLKPRGERETTLHQALRDYASRGYDKVVVRLTPLAREATSPWVLVLLARALQQIGRPRAALEFLRRAVGRSAHAFRMRLELARGLALADQRDGATRLFLALHGERPRGARTLLDLGRLGLRLGRLDAVRAVIKVLRRENASSGHGAYLTGLLHLRGKRRREARNSFESALMRDPNHVASRIELARLAFGAATRGVAGRCTTRPSAAPDGIPISSWSWPGATSSPTALSGADTPTYARSCCFATPDPGTSPRRPCPSWVTGWRS